MEDIIWKSEDESLEVKLVYISRTIQRRYKGVGKRFPKHTQCLMFVNGLLENYGEVVKHENDKNNPQFAYIQATKKALKALSLRNVRKEIWDILFERLKTYSEN